jgi:ParB family chromosome partitioning protein
MDQHEHHHDHHHEHQQHEHNHGQQHEHDHQQHDHQQHEHQQGHEHMSHDQHQHDHQNHDQQHGDHKADHQHEQQHNHTDSHSGSEQMNDQNHDQQSSENQHHNQESRETIPMTGRDEPVANPKRRLGRGLDALLGGGSPVSHSHLSAYNPQEQTGPTQSEGGVDVRMLPVGNVFRNPNQPRKIFSKDSLKELADSLVEHGMLQPIIVRQIVGGFQIVAGERRWLASQQAGLQSIPCRVIDVIDKTAYEYAFEENIKRQDLSDIEKAISFKEYIDMFQSTPDELARQLSMSRSAVSNTLRLLDLPVPIKNAIQESKLTAGHARALLSLGVQDQLKLAEEIQSKQWTVRQTEAAVRELQDSGEASSPDGKSTKAKKPKPKLTSHIKSLQDQLREVLGAPVEIKLKSKEAGQIVITFKSNEEFEGILDRLQQHRAAA